MTVNFENESEYEFDFDYEQVAYDVLTAAFSLFPIKNTIDFEINISLVNDDEIKEINYDNRGIDNSTDVLSFPMFSYDNPGDYNSVNNDLMFIKALKSRATKKISYFTFGDIILSYDHILEQSKNYGHSIKREYAFLIAHSILHLLGFDHIFEEDMKVMEEKQEEIMKIVNITRD